MLFCAVANTCGQLKPYEIRGVKLLESRFKTAEQRNLEYLLALDADRLLAPFLENAGLRDGYTIADHFFKGENSYRGVGEENYYRSTRDEISYQM